MISLLRKIAHLRYAIIPRPWYYGARYRQIASFLDQSKSWGPERMNLYQLDALKRLVRIAYERVPFYRRLYDNHGFKPEDLRSFKDFGQLPIVERENIVTSVSEFKASDFDNHQPRLTHTSGTSGSPLKLYRSLDTELYRSANIWRWRRAIGFDYYQRMVDVTGKLDMCESDPLFHWDAPDNILHLNRCFRDKEHALKIFDTIRQWRPVMIHGYPSALTALGQHALELGIAPMETPLISLIGESLNPLYRSVIEKAFGSNIYDVYANRENTVSSCQYKTDGDYLINAESCYLEIISRNGEELPSGQAGEVISTSLVNFAFPLIRYRVGDIAQLNGYQRQNGFHLPSLELKGGRNKDLILTRDGIIPIFSIYSLEGSGITQVRFFRFVQETIDDITVEVVAGDGYVRERDEPRILERIRKYFPYEMRFSFRYIDKPPVLPGGKVKCVESKLAENYLSGNSD